MAGLGQLVLEECEDTATLLKFRNKAHQNKNLCRAGGGRGLFKEVDRFCLTAPPLQLAMATPQLHIISDSSKIQDTVCDFIAARAKQAAQDHSYFSIGLSGGSVSKIVSLGLRDRKDVDWSTWRVFYCDERLVPFSDGDSTHAYFQRELYDRVPVSDVNAIDPSLSVEEAAVDYTVKIRKLYPGDAMPTFDLLLLGMGPDGHTCSLFPDHPGLAEKEKLVIPISDSPKPPPCRITLTVPVLNAAKCVAVISTGASKADAVKGCLEPEEGKQPLPAGMARPTAGELHWYMDEGASSKLEKKA